MRLDGWRARLRLVLLAMGSRASHSGGGLARPMSPASQITGNYIVTVITKYNCVKHSINAIELTGVSRSSTFTTLASTKWMVKKTKKHWYLHIIYGHI